MFARFDSYIIKEHLQSVEWSVEGADEFAASRIAEGLATLRSTIEIELGNHYFYHYPPGKMKSLLDVEREWGPVFSVFPEVRPDVVAGTDCYASGLDTACVFHMMRAAEIGLRRLATEARVKLNKGKPVTHAQWGEILGALDKKVRQIENSRAGPAKDAALSYHSMAQSHLRALRDRYRNNVMHARRSFDEHEARDAMFHARSFLVGLTQGKKPNRDS